MASPEVLELFTALGLTPPEADGGLEVEDPSTGTPVARVAPTSAERAEQALSRSTAIFAALREVPAPLRGELVRRMGQRLREHQETLARIVTLEVGKGIAEARGEVQEMIDVCDFACGLSRTLGGPTLPSERVGHRMFEQWHPLGPVLCITAFNFPVAVWAWNAALALVCGDPVVWKPSPKAPLSALAVHGLLRPIWAEAGLGDALELVVTADSALAESLVADPRFPLVSATGSCAMGRRVGPVVAARMGRTLLELGGNNAVIVDATADLALATRAIAFGAVGTAGQRCTSTRRLFVAASVADELLRRLESAYAQLAERIGDPRDPDKLVGPLIDAAAVAGFGAVVAEARALGAELRFGGEVLDRAGHFVVPTLFRVPEVDEFAPMERETFAPILWVKSFPDGELDRVIAWHNRVEQGLSSALFTNDLRASERFLGPSGSDCGIANVNLGTSGAEIGGAFGGEKATGGGRESGSDAWKTYMRRQTCTVNGSGQLPLSQGIRWE